MSDDREKLERARAELTRIQATLREWAREARAHWSTQHVDPMRRMADGIDDILHETKPYGVSA